MRSDLPTIMVTGASGFVGRNVVAALAGRARVVPATIDGTRADLLDADARRALIGAARPEILLHLAWVTEHGKFWSSPLNETWEAASADLFRRFLDAGGRRVVGAGSCAEYDWTTGAGRFAETAPLAPHTDYGAAKVRTAERLERLAGAAGAGWAWGRIFFSFGPGEPPGRLVPLMLGAVRSGVPLDIGPGDTQRDFWPVATLGAALAALALSPVQGPVNVASGHGTPLRDLAALIERLAGTHGLIRPDRRPLGPGEPARLIADAGRLRREVGFGEDPPLEKTLAEYLTTLP